MTLQKCLLEETDIVPLLESWELKVENDEVVVINPPTFTVPETESETA